MPVVTLITALFNKGDYIGETLRSVLSQTMRDWEMIVVNNSSIDDGPEIVRRCVDLRVRLEDVTKCGPGAARNCGLDQASGDWVVFLDADDLLAPTYLEEQIAAASRNPKAKIIAGCWQEFADGTQERAELRYPTGYRDAPCRIAESAIAFAPWALHAAIVRRDWLGNRIRWFEHLDGWPSEDTAFWFAAIQGADIAWSESTGAFYRINTANSRNSPKDADLWFKGLKQVIETNLDTLARSGKAPSPVQQATIMRTFESRYQKELSNGNDEVAGRFLAEASRWLHACPFSHPSIALRKILGLRLVNQLRQRARNGNVSWNHH